jgi:hypothetical protein
MTPLENRPDHATDAIAARLEAERPVPRAAFRGELRRRLVASAGLNVTPARVRLLVTAYSTAGLALLTIAATGLTGVGPFAA